MNPANEIVPVAAPHLDPLPRALPPDGNPALVYLARLSGETSATVMRRCLQRAGAILARWLRPGDGPQGAPVPFYELPWSALRYQHVAALRAEWVRSGLRPRTVNQLLSAVKGVLDEAENLGLVTPDDARRIAKVRGVKVHGEVLAGREVDDDEVRAMVDACDTSTEPGLRNLALLALLFGGGLRRAEVAKLCVSDFNRARGEVTVHGKGSKDRVVPLSSDAVTMVAAWLSRGITSGAQPLLVAFSLRDGVKMTRAGVPAPLTSPGVYSALLSLAKRAKIAPLAPHDARRKRITQMLLAGESIVLVQRIAGHESAETTGHYVRTGQDQAREAAVRVTMLK